MILLPQFYNLWRHFAPFWGWMARAMCQALISQEKTFWAFWRQFREIFPRFKKINQDKHAPHSLQSPETALKGPFISFGVYLPVKGNNSPYKAVYIALIQYNQTVSPYAYAGARIKVDSDIEVGRKPKNKSNNMILSTPSDNGLSIEMKRKSALMINHYR